MKIPTQWSNEEMRSAAEEWLRARGWVHKHHSWPWVKDGPDGKVRASSFGHALEREMDWDIPHIYMESP